jgi:hypothetical protein
MGDKRKTTMPEPEMVEALSAFSMRATFDPHRVVFLPAGIQRISPMKGPKSVVVEVTHETAETMEAHRQAVEAESGKRCYFDFRHEDREASFWPKRFEWGEAEKAVVAVGDYSDIGAAAIEGRRWREFSPRFFIEPPHGTLGTEGNPCRVVVNAGAKPNLGGFVNDGAFDGVALWAGRAEGNSQSAIANRQDILAGAAGRAVNQANKGNMTEQELAALKAKQTELETEIQALKATVSGNAQDELAKARLGQKEAELRAAAAEILAANNAAEAGVAKKEIKDRNVALGKAAIEAAKRRGAIPTQGPKAAEIEAKYLALVEADSSNGVLIESLAGNEVLAGRLTSGSATRVEGGFSAQAALKKYQEIVARSTTKIGQGARLNRQTIEDQALVAIEAANFYAQELDPHFASFANMPVREIMAATDADSLGTLAGTLVLQRSLPLFKYQFPVLSALYTDFSATPGMYNQTEETRIITVPSVQTFNNDVGADGRPKGWDTVKAAQTTDVPIKLDEHVGVPIVFGQNTLASTIRRLFDEQGPAAVYAMAKYYVAKMAALITAGNFNGYAVATQDGKIPDAYATFAVALKNFSMDAIDTLEAIFDANEVPADARGILLNAKYHGQLRKDPRLGLFFAAMQKPDMITKGLLPELDGFLPHRAPWLPSANNLVGFAFHKAAILLKQRLPTDFTEALNVMIPGSVTTIVDPETGLSCLLVQYVSLQGGYAEWRVETLLGASVGDKRGGLCLTS